MKYFHCLLKITFKVTLYHPCRPAPNSGNSLVQSTDTASWGKDYRLCCAHTGGLTRPTNPRVKGARILADSPLRLLQSCPPGRLETQARVLSQQGQRILAHLDPWVTGRREDIGVDIGD